MRFGIFIYDGVEPIDLATFGVLSMARRIAPQIEICTIAPNAGIVRLSNGLDVVAQFGMEQAPACDIVIVTGGPGWEDQSRSPATLAYIRRTHALGKVASVCTGAMILAASGVLDDAAARPSDPSCLPKFRHSRACAARILGSMFTKRRSSIPARL
jgi:transcriptional regulator GlxA family with amidase domain